MYRRRARSAELAVSVAWALVLLSGGLQSRPAHAAEEESRCAVAVSAPRAEPEGAAAIALDRGNEQLRAGDAASALVSFRASETVARSAGELRLAELAAASAARASVLSGDAKAATVSLEKVAARSESLSSKGARARLDLHLARSYVLVSEATAGDVSSRARLRAAELYQRAAGLAVESQNARTGSYALGQLGGLYASQGRSPEALTLTRRALLLASQADAPDALYRWQWQLGQIHAQVGAWEESLAAYRSAVATLDRLRAELAMQSGEAAFEFKSEVEPVYLELVDLLLRRSEGAEEAVRTSLLREARDTLEAFKAAELRQYFRDPCLDAQRVAEAEDVPGTVVLYPIVLADRVVLLVSDASGIRAHRVPVDRSTLTTEAQLLRRLVGKRTTRQYLKPARNLYDWLIEPIAARLREDDVRALVVVPGGVLRTIPFAVLQDRRTNEFLIEQVPLATTPGIELTEPRALDPDKVALLAVGVSEAVQGFPAIENVEYELDEITKLFPSEKLLNDGFLADGFDHAVASRPFDIVHVASHGEFRGDISESFVLAWDGPLSMHRMAAAISRTSYRTERPLEILILSACSTAEGDERAALGLAGVAVRAGARSALATLWSVNDLASAQLIVDFYKELRSGASRAEALQRAQLRLMAHPAYSHPTYWAPYLLINGWL